MASLGRTEHESLVDGAKTSDLVLGRLEPCLELLGGHLKELDVGGRPVEQRDLARLLIGDGEGLLEAAVAITELVPAPLLRLDPLAANGLATRIATDVGRDRGYELFILIVAVVPGRPSPCRGLAVVARDRAGRHGVEAVAAASRGGGVAIVRCGRRVRDTPAPAPIGSVVLRGLLAAAEVVRDDGRRHGLGGRKRPGGRRAVECTATAGLLVEIGHSAGKVQRGEIGRQGDVVLDYCAMLC